MASSSNRHPVAWLGGAASLITVLGFFGVQGWSTPQPRASVAATGTLAPAPAVTAPPATLRSTPPAPAPSTTCACPDRTPPPATVSCVIADTLGEGQVAEAVTLRFGSKTWTLTVDESGPTDRLTLRFPRAGSYRYAVTSATETSTGDTVYGAGQGTIACRGGQTFQVVADDRTVPLTLSLEEA